MSWFKNHYKRELAITGFFAAAAALIILGPVIFGNKVLLGDSLDYFIPQLNFYKEAMQSGQSVVWNPLGGGGIPFGGSALQIFNPFIFIALKFLSPIGAFNAALALFLAAGVFFAIRFFRELGLSLAAALLGGLSYLIGESSLANNPVFAAPVAVLPLIFLLIWRVSRLEMNHWRWAIYILIGIFAVWLGWIAGTYWPMLYGGSAALIFSLFLSWRRSKQPLVYCLIIILGASLLALPVLLPVYAMTKVSARAGGLSYEQAAEGGINWPDLWHLVYYGQGGVDIYGGLLPFALLIWSFFIRNNRLIWFFRFSYAAALAISLKFSPLFLLIHQLPLFNYFRVPSRFMFVGLFAGAALAAWGMDRGLAVFKSKTKLIYAAVLIILTIADLILVYQKVFRGIPQKLVEEKPAIAKFAETYPGRIFFILPEEFFSEYYYFKYEQPPPGNKESNFIQEWTMSSPNYNFLQSVENIDLYEPLTNFYLARYLALLGGGRKIISQIDPAEKLTKMQVNDVADKLAVFNQRRSLADFLGINYFVSGFDLKKYNIDFPLLAQIDATDAYGEIYTLDILFNPSARTIVYFSGISGYSGDSEAAFQSFKNSGFRGLFVECDDCSPEFIGQPPAGDISMKADFFSQKIYNRVELQTSAPQENFLVLSQTYYPGWKAYT
jgi:hypothetical protein